MTNDLLDGTFQPQAHGKVHGKQQLGDIIKSYFRARYASKALSPYMCYELLAPVLFSDSRSS